MRYFWLIFALWILYDGIKALKAGNPKKAYREFIWLPVMLWLAFDFRESLNPWVVVAINGFIFFLAVIGFAWGVADFISFLKNRGKQVNT